jgi:DNA-binding CsgD family transcriptional regulator
MVYTEKELINLHKCTVFKLDILTQLSEKRVVEIGEDTRTLITINRSSDFSYGALSPKSLEFYGRTQDELNKEDESFVLDRVRSDSAERILPALIGFYQNGDQNTTFTDIQVIRRDVDQPFENILTSSKISANGNFLTFNLRLKELGSLGRKMERELQISRQFQRKLPQFLTLTKGQKRILTLLAQGLTNREIGVRLLCSSHTARTHRMAIYKKLDISSLKQAIEWAITFNLV